MTNGTHDAAEAALLEWGCRVDEVGRLVTPNGRIRWTKAEHGWYREDRNAHGEFQGLAFKLMDGGPRISAWLRPARWHRRDELAAACKVIIDELAGDGVDEFTETLAFVSDHVDQARADADPIAEERWAGVLERLVDLTHCVAWPSACVERWYREGVARRAERRAEAKPKPKRRRRAKA